MVDARDHREVQVRVGVAGHLVSLAPYGGGGEPPLGHERDDVEVQPPERRGQHHAERRRGDDARVDMSVRADSDRHDRLAERDQEDEAVALGEVPGHELPPVGAEEVRPSHVQQEREGPEAALEPAVRERGAEEQPDSERRAAR